MEVLSGVASGMAVASLSIQLVDSISTIKTFIHNVKDAPKELERLVDLLERLEALLEDVRALMERQTSLQAQHFPKPSMTIFKCLKSSEKTLEPLQAIVERCTPSKSKTGGGIDKLKSGLKISLKAKDIKDLEARIEREINFLHASLGANCGAIL
jgi:DNA repair exonuclease SbcCD ATPase subunit